MTDIEYHPNSKVIKKIFHHNGDTRYIGEFITYYKNGKIKNKCLYKNHMLDGRSYHKNESGKFAVDMFYNRGVREGEYIGYVK